MSENTDIIFTYEPIRRGKGGKIVAVKFNIEKNTEYVDPLRLDKFIDMKMLTEQEEEPQEIDILSKEDMEEEGQKNVESDNISESEVKEYANSFKNENLEFLSEACNNEFDEEKMAIIKSYIIKLVPFDSKTYEVDQYDYLLSKYRELNYSDKKKKENGEKITDRFRYLIGILKVELKNNNLFDK